MGRARTSHGQIRYVLRNAAPAVSDRTFDPSPPPRQFPPALEQFFSETQTEFMHAAKNLAVCQPTVSKQYSLTYNALEVVINHVLAAELILGGFVDNSVRDDKFYMLISLQSIRGDLTFQRTHLVNNYNSAMTNVGRAEVLEHYKKPIDELTQRVAHLYYLNIPERYVF